MNKRKGINLVFSCYKQVFLCSPALSICEALSYLGSAVISGLMPLIWKYLFDTIPNAIETKSFIVAFPAVVWFVVFQIAEVTFRLLGRVAARVFGYNEKIILALKSQLYEHVCSIPLICFENKENYDSFERAGSAINRNAAVKMVDYLYQTPAMILSFIIMIISLWTFDPVLVAIAFLAVIPISLLQMIKSLKHFKMYQRQAADRRAKNYFWSLFLLPSNIKDIRVYQVQKFFMDKWLKSCKKVNEEEKTFYFKYLKKQIITDLIKIFGNCSGIIFSACLLFFEKITIGSFGAIINAFQNLQSNCLQIISNLQGFRESYLFYNDYLTFMDIQKIKTGNEKLNDDFNIKLINVSFSYPNKLENALENISLKINKNEHIAIVGENGSGKTTLCRLLSGLYSPVSGSVLYNKLPVSEYEKSYTDKISAVFQDYIKYLFNVRSNVGFGDIDNLKNDTRIYEALKKSDNSIQPSAIDLDNQLGREFGGYELSGGQWQRLAIARGYMPECANFFIFDEPMSSIDPIQESAIFKSFMEQTDKYTSIVVTHRIGAAKLANRIIVMDKGKIIEEGTHAELMQLNGKYAEMYTAQAKWYGTE